MSSIQDVFNASGGKLITDNSAVDVSTAKQAIADGQAAQTQAFDAIKAKSNGPRVVGGGQYGVLNQQRGNLVLGPLGGLATANRTAFAGVAKQNNLVNEQVDRGTAIMSNNPGWTRENAAAAQTPQGYAVESGLPDPNFAIAVHRYDESGTGTTTYRPR